MKAVKLKSLIGFQLRGSGSIVCKRPFLSSPYVYHEVVAAFPWLGSAPFVAVGIGQWPRWDIVLSSPMARALPASLDHPGRGLKRHIGRLRAIRRYVAAATCSAQCGGGRAEQLSCLCAPDHYGHLQHEGERVKAAREQLLQPSGSLALNVNHILTRARLHCKLFCYLFLTHLYHNISIR